MYVYKFIIQTYHMSIRYSRSSITFSSNFFNIPFLIIIFINKISVLKNVLEDLVQVQSHSTSILGQVKSLSRVLHVCPGKKLKLLLALPYLWTNSRIYYYAAADSMYSNIDDHCSSSLSLSLDFFILIINYIYVHN